MLVYNHAKFSLTKPFQTEHGEYEEAKKPILSCSLSPSLLLLHVFSYKVNSKILETHRWLDHTTLLSYSDKKTLQKLAQHPMNTSCQIKPLLSSNHINYYIPLVISYHIKQEKLLFHWGWGWVL